MPAGRPGSVPAYVEAHPTAPYIRLNPATKLVLAVVAAVFAFILRGWTGPAIALAMTVPFALLAGVMRRSLVYLLATLPILISITLIDTFLYPGAGDVALRLGPLAATGTGLFAAGQADLRVIAFAMSASLFSLTTATDDLLDDLGRRGLGRRASFVIGAAVRTVPRMIERAGEIVDAQRARGLDTQGGILRRVRGVVPLAGPMLTSALGEVEERTLALEARAFSAPGRRTVIRRLPDSELQRFVRWGAAFISVAVIAATLAGRLDLP